MGGQFGPRLLNDALGILLSEVLEFAVAVQGLSHGVGLIAGDMTGEILAVLPGLQFEVRSLWPLGHERQFAPFHVFDLSDLFQELSR